METKFLPRRIKISGGGYFAKKTILCQIRHVVRHTPLRISASYKEGLTFDPALTFRKQFIY